MRKWYRILWIASLGILAAVGVWWCTKDTATYAREAAAFLAGRDGSVQARQIAAIRQATAGETNALVAVRAARNTLAPLPEGVTATMVLPEARLYAPTHGHDLPLLIYLHGGGWVIGSIASCSAFCGAVAANGVAVLALDYPLAPEHPFPAALDFVAAVYRLVAVNPAQCRCDPKRIAIGGDSSGGNLALAAAFRLQGTGLAPSALVLYYPVTAALADGTAAWRDYATGFGMDAAFMDACNAAYLNGHDSRDPLVSPLYATDAQLAALPPVHLLAADHDVLRDQGKAFADRLKALGGPVRYENPRGTTHLFVTVPGQPAAFNRAVAFAVEACR
ncbi:MAG: alpha/beta hydrolase [Kiritimatiellia bacterium]